MWNEKAVKEQWEKNQSCQDTADSLVGTAKMSYHLMQKSLPPWLLILWLWPWPQASWHFGGQRRGNDLFTPSFAAVTGEGRSM